MPAKVEISNDGRTFVDGVPFFLIGARHMPENGSPELLRDTGFNAYRVLPFGHETTDPEPMPEKLEGIYFWDYVYDRTILSKKPEYERELREHIAAVSQHPSLLCYENLNEVTMRNTKEGYKCSPEDLLQGTNVIREIDPNRPIWMCYHCSNTVEALQEFNECADALGCNPYPVYGSNVKDRFVARPDGRILDCIDQSIHAVGKYTDKMRAITRDEMPVWMLTQAVANENWENKEGSVENREPVYPTLEQMRFMTWDIIASGAKGLAFSMCRTPTKGQIWDDIRRVVGELHGLHDVLAAPEIDGEVSIEYTDLGYTIWDGVRTTTRKGATGTYLFAVNTAFDPAEVTMHLPATAGKRAIVLGEDRELPVEANAIHDRFGPYGVHLYHIKEA